MSKKKRISGVGMTTATGGPYAREMDDGAWMLDVGEVSTRMAAYLDDAAQRGKYSVAGMCLGLGITREVYELWRCGYVCAEDAGDETVVRNEALSECIGMGELHLQKFWEESDKSTSLHMKMLESTGVIGQKARPKLQPPFDLGALDKYAR